MNQRERHLETMRFNRSIPLAGILAATCCLLLLLLLAIAPDRASAATSPFEVEFDTSELQVSVIENLPLDSLSTKASLKGTIDENGNVKVPANGFKLPELGIAEPVAIKGFMGIEGPMTGTFDSATGKLVLDGKAGIWVSVNIQDVLGAASGLGLDLGGSLGSIGSFLPLLGENLTCGFSPMDIQFSTEANSQAEGQRFATGPLGPGALAAEWSQLGPFAGRTKLLGIIDVCKEIPRLLPGLLGGLGGGAGLGGIDLGGLLEGIDLTQLDNINLGPSAITLTRTSDDTVPVDPPIVDGDPAKLKLTVTPKTRKAKAGHSVKYRASVKNAGGAVASRVKVCVRAPKKAARKPRTCRSLGAIKPGATSRGSFRLKLKKGATRRTYRVGFQVLSSAGKPKSSARLRVK